MAPDFTPVLNVNEPISEQVKIRTIGDYVVLAYNGAFYPIKQVRTPASKFSTAHYLKRNSKVAVEFAPEFEYDVHVLGGIIYQVWDNKLVIPSNFSQSPRLSF